ncbi:MAG: YdcF family protein [Planctomycetota bacterium]
MAARGACLFLGGIASIEVLARLRGLDGLSVLPLDLRRAPVLGSLFVPVFAVAALALASGRIRRVATRRAAGVVVLLGAAIALENAVVVSGLGREGRVALGAWPLSVFLAALLVLASFAARRRAPIGRAGVAMALAVATLLALAYPVAQIETYGRSDYRRAADVAVVFGARTYADGRPSRALAERVRTACRLHRDGLVSRIVLSGGPGDGEVHETEAMRRLAREEGVPDADLLLDPRGLDTRETLAFVRGLGLDRRPLAVSHDFHLARIKLAAGLEGIDVLTVPVDSREPLPGRSRTLLRETAAYWYYLLRGMTV